MAKKKKARKTRRTKAARDSVKVCHSWTGKRMPKCKTRSVCRAKSGKFTRKSVCGLKKKSR